MTVFEDIAGLMNQAKQVHLIEEQDETYVRNQVLHLLDLQAFPEQLTSATNDTIPNLLEKLISYAIQENVIADVFDDKEMLTAKIMDCFVARPSTIQHYFDEKYEASPQAATDYFYELSKNSNYIQMNRIAKNVHFQADTVYGSLDITINLSKPEKDPEQIKREKELKQTLNYPPCVLCRENEGYVGRIGYPARANHRVIQIPLTNENWFFQYSPYVYYNEHSIVLSEEHRDMKISKETFARLLEFVDKFPHYFIGSNADLPIVGGSILNHDHYQAGNYTFAMQNAEAEFNFTLDDFPEISASVLKWPMSVIRLKGENKETLVQAGSHLLNTWKNYQDQEANIIPYTNDTSHNTVTPIARYSDGQFELDIVLRNNRTNEQYPMGIFHPHEEVHHIKKENIGLIEVMGLAVLPARLKQELEEIKAFLLNESPKVAAYHETWAAQLKQQYGQLQNDQEATAIIQKELGNKFATVLEHAGVFKLNASGRKAFKQFIDTLNN